MSNSILKTIKSAATSALVATAIISSATVSADDITSVNITDNGKVTFQEARRIFDFLDAMDVKNFTKMLTENGEVKFGNGPGMFGPAAVAEGQKGFFSMIKKMEHTLNPEGFWAKEGSFVLEGDVTYTRFNDTKVTVPFTDTFWLEGNKIKTLNVYFDLAPLFASE